ncbi:MAG: hypothetical protein Q4E49_00660 [Bacteroidales bacterium]|nr:hypothetical protein [Bacteroidales bacterium]
MKKSLFCMLLCVAIGVNAQKYTARRTVQMHNAIAGDSLKQNHIFRAGTLLRQSATVQYASIGCGCISSVLLATGYDRDNKGLKTAGFVFAGATLLTQLYAIDCKLRSGRELQIGAGKIVFKF